MGFFKNIGNKIADTAKGIKNKIDSKIQEHKENKELHKKLDEAFKKEAIEFIVYYNDGKTKKFYGILVHEEKLIRLEADLNKNDVKKLSDNKGNDYYVVRINPKKFEYQESIQTGTDEYTLMEKELDEIEYTNEKPKEEKPSVTNTYNITNTDNSTTIKGVKNSNVNSTDSKVDSKKEVSVGVDISANLQQKKGE